MEVNRTRALRGPNLWSRHTAIEAVVTCDGAERDLSANPAFERLPPGRRFHVEQGAVTRLV